MEESATYQAIISKGEEKGELREAKKTLLRLGRTKLGAPDPSTAAVLESLSELTFIERLTDRLLDVDSWHELLGR